MYAIKGGWVGQTFALAPCNESGGRKARVRRSKEERRTMVESFIQKYQSLNNGKFPSLNITHKEVGGSFYTIREIVRDIIQENRVLGPAKFSSENQKFDGRTRDFSLESATVESQDYLFQLEIENPAVLDQQESSNMEMNVNVNEQYGENKVVDDGKFDGSNAAEKSDKLIFVESLLNHSVGGNRETMFVGASTDFYGNMSMKLNIQNNEQLHKNVDFGVENLVNGSLIEEDIQQRNTNGSLMEEDIQQRNTNGSLMEEDIQQRNTHGALYLGKYVNGTEVEESDKLDCLEASLIEKHGVDSNFGSVEPNIIEVFNPTEDVVVETFPLRYVTEDICNESRGLIGESQKEYVDPGNGGAVMDKMDTPDNAIEPIAQKGVNKELIMVHEATTNESRNLLEIEDPSRSGEASDIYTHDHNEPTIDSHNNLPVLKIVDDRQTTRGAKAKYYQNTAGHNSYYGAKNGYGNNNGMELTTESAIIVGRANEIQKENQAPEETKPTLDRINLGSWEGASKKSSEQERNPLLNFLKSVMSAFRNFWSE